MKNTAIIQNSAEKGYTSNRSNNKRSTYELLTLTIPGIIWFLLFSYLPMFGIIIAFKNFKYSEGIFGSEWVGFSNFKYLFGSNDAFRIVRNTLAYNSMFIISNTVISIIMATLLVQVTKKWFIKTTQTSIMLPYFISWVVVGYMAATFLDFEKGFLNSIISSYGGEKISWYAAPKYWWMILLSANTWKTLGSSVLIYYGTIIGIDKTLYEAAEVDGCSGFKAVWYITLPLLRPTITILIILAIGNIMRADFGLFYYITNNSPTLYPSTDVIDTYLYRSMRVMGDISGSAAISLFQSFVGFVLVILTNYVSKKVDNDTSLF